jgi:hypothetical protein
MSRINGYLSSLNESIELSTEAQYVRAHSVDVPEHYDGSGTLCLNNPVPYGYADPLLRLVKENPMVYASVLPEDLAVQLLDNTFWTEIGSLLASSHVSGDIPRKRKNVLITHEKPIRLEPVSSHDGNRVRSFGDVMRCLAEKK